MTPNPNERVSLHAYRAFVGAGVGLFLPWMFRWTQADAFGGVLPGARWVSLIAGVLCILFTLPILFGCREQFAAKAAKQEKIPFFKSLRETFSNRPFLVFELGIVTVILAAPLLVGSMLVYVNSFYVYGGDTKAGAALAAITTSMFVIVKVVVLPFSVKLVSRYGRLRIMKWALLLGMVGAFLQFFLITPHAPYLQLLSALLISPAYTAFWLLVDPIKADCADYDEWKTGLRREGSYASVANWIEKMAVSLVLLLSGVILDSSGFDAELGADQGEGTMLFMRVAIAFIPGISFVIALIALGFFKLTDPKMREIREDLESRSTQEGSAPESV